MPSCPKCGTSFTQKERLCPHDGSVLEGVGTGEEERIGQVLAGKYKLESFLSRGGMGAVYRATHVMLGKPVAVKLINPELVSSPEVVRRFQREARAASLLDHPNIVAVHDLGQAEDGSLFIAMELVGGKSLKETIRSGGPMEPGRIVRILTHIASGLALAHRNNIIHRDLKPHNIMLCKDSEGREVAKLLDFGIAKTFEIDAGTQLTSTGTVLGTPQYMAPEQAQGKPIDARTDIYSLGVILYEMLAGDVPFNDPSMPAILVKHISEPPVRPSKRHPERAIPFSLERIAMRCLEKEPDKRYRSVQELAADLEVSLTPAAQAAPVPTLKLGASTGATAAPAPSTAAGTPLAADDDALSPTLTVAPGGSSVSRRAAPPAAATAGASASVSADADATVSRTAARTAPSSPPTAGRAVPVTTPVPASAAPPEARKSALPAVAAIAALLVLALVGGALALRRRGGDDASFAGRIASIFASEPKSDAPASLAAPAASAAPATAVAPTASTPVPPPAAPPPPAPMVAVPLAEPQPPVVSPGSAPAGAPAGSAPATTTSGPAAPAVARQLDPPMRAADPPPAGEPAYRADAPRPHSRADRPARAPGRPADEGDPVPAAPRESGSAMPADPPVFFRCEGETEVCGALRAALPAALEKEGLPLARGPARAEVVVTLRATLLDERAEVQFGTTFVVRSYALDIEGEAPRFDLQVSMPAPEPIRFDPRFGSERLRERARVVAGEVAERIRAFWTRRSAGAAR